MSKKASVRASRRAKIAPVQTVPRPPRIDLVVDQKTINEAIARNSSHCMIAEAITKSVTYAKGVSVDLQLIRFTDHDRGLRYSYLTPRIAQVALIKFDQGQKPSPFTLHLKSEGASVRRAKHQPRAVDHMLDLKERLRVIAVLQEARDKRKVSIAEIADATDIAPRSLERYVSASPPVFSKLVADKLTAWIEGRPGRGRPHVVPPSLVSGAARQRQGIKGAHAMPSIVGGANPPIGNIAKRRGFGLKSMVI